MSEEGFKPIRITLSDEAFERLEKIMKTAAFRSYSAAIEECIRVVYDIAGDIWLVAGGKNEPDKRISQIDAYNTFRTITIRMGRFTSRVPKPIK